LLLKEKISQINKVATNGNSREITFVNFLRFSRILLVGKNQVNRVVVKETLQQLKGIFIFLRAKETRVLLNTLKQSNFTVLKNKCNG